MGLISSRRSQLKSQRYIQNPYRKTFYLEIHREESSGWWVSMMITCRGTLLPGTEIIQVVPGVAESDPPPPPPAAYVSSEST